VRDVRFHRLLSVATVVAALASACTGAPAHEPSPGTTAVRGSTNAGSATNLPNPFKVTRRFSPASLGLQRPLGLAVGPDGNLYITDAAPSVTVVSPDGKVLHHWGTSGSGRGAFDFIPDLNGNLRAPIAVGPNGNVYVSDQGNGRIDVHTADGKYVDQFGSKGIQDGEFLNNQTLTVDAGGNVYVADDAAQSILKFAPDGRFVSTIQGGSTAADPDLRGHFVLEDVDSHNRIVAGVDTSHQVVYLDANGHRVEAFSTAGLFRNDWGPCDVTVDHQGDTLVQSCPDAGHHIPGVPSYQAALLFDRNHALVGAWYGTPWSDFFAPRPGTNGDWFALGTDGSVIKLRVTLPGA